MIIEGCTDAQVYKRLIQADIDWVIAHQKALAIETITVLDKRGISGYVAIVDADFDHLENIKYASPNIVLTDFHDIEMLMFSSETLDFVLDEFGSRSKITKFKAAHGPLREALIQRSRVVGELRLASKKCKLGLNFNDISYDFVDARDLSFDPDRLMRHFAAVPKMADKAIRDSFLLELESVRKQNFDGRQVCCGHDTVAVLGRALARVLGNVPSQVRETANLERVLRLAYSRDHFQATELWKKLTDWATLNDFGIA
jgi:hypothetical protein